ncbi:hypothetical protein SV7mr_03430 [Stieleria bergensis]|uniref:Uncharacterized protein n=1 Tax=Stieleria bergensis TaxID=2528025 RepID=A0A517SP17_9BACT|nr:hypothetical protein SV7mr_03430 [Planctomycetes bacterium SV_7m_r]
MCFASRGNCPDPLGTVPVRYVSRDHGPDPLGTVPVRKVRRGQSPLDVLAGVTVLIRWGQSPVRCVLLAGVTVLIRWGQSPWEILASVDHCSKLQGTVPVRWGWRGSVFDGCGSVIALWLVRASTAGICARFPVGHSGGRSVARSKRCQQLAVIMSAAMAAAQVPVIAPNK